MPIQVRLTEDLAGCFIIGSGEISGQEVLDGVRHRVVLETNMSLRYVIYDFSKIKSWGVRKEKAEKIFKTLKSNIKGKTFFIIALIEPPENQDVSIFFSRLEEHLVEDEVVIQKFKSLDDVRPWVVKQLYEKHKIKIQEENVTLPEIPKIKNIIIYSIHNYRGLLIQGNGAVSARNLLKILSNKFLDPTLSEKCLYIIFDFTNVNNLLVTQKDLSIFDQLLKKHQHWAKKQLIIMIVARDKMLLKQINGYHQLHLIVKTQWTVKYYSLLNEALTWINSSPQKEIFASEKAVPYEIFGIISVKDAIFVWGPKEKRLPTIDICKYPDLYGLCNKYQSNNLHTVKALREFFSEQETLCYFFAFIIEKSLNLGLSANDIHNTFSRIKEYQINMGPSVSIQRWESIPSIDKTAKLLIAAVNTIVTFDANPSLVHKNFSGYPEYREYFGLKFS